MVLDGGGKKSGVLLLGPVELSKLRTTNGNIVVTSCQVLMSAVILRLLVVVGSHLHSSAAGKGPGLKPIECEVRFFAGLKPACGRQVQLPLLKQGAPTERRASAGRGARGGHCAIFGACKQRLARGGCESVLGSGRIWAILMKVI
jgi:hypothetical protein